MVLASRPTCALVLLELTVCVAADMVELAMVDSAELRVEVAAPPPWLTQTIMISVVDEPPAPDS